MIPPFQPPARVTPLAPERYALQVTISQETHDKLRRAQELLSHSLPSGNVAEVLDRALDALIRDLEKKKYAATQKPQAKARASKDPRHIPAHVKRAVLARDRGRCTFVSDSGVRCSSRRFLEFDHIHEVARGGRATVSGIRLLCRTHNQYAAECTFGAGFMDEKRRAKAEDHGSLKQRQDAGAAGNEAASAARSTVAKAAERAVSSTVGREPPSVVGSAGEPAAFHASPEKASLAEVFERARLEGFLNTPAPKAPTCNGVIRSPVGDAARLPAMPT